MTSAVSENTWSQIHVTGQSYKTSRHVGLLSSLLVILKTPTLVKSISSMDKQPMFLELFLLVLDCAVLFKI